MTEVKTEWTYSVFVLAKTYDSLQEARDHCLDRECIEMQTGDGFSKTRVIETRVKKDTYPYEVSSFETYDRIKIMLEEGGWEQ